MHGSRVRAPDTQDGARVGGHVGWPDASYCQEEHLMICSDSMIGISVRTGRVRPWIVAALLAAAVPLAQGCATDRAGGGATEEGPTGELVISLTQPGPHGEIYHL